MLDKDGVRAVLVELNLAIDRDDEAAFRRLVGSLMGRITTDHKRQTSRENGKKGGKPKGSAVSEETKAKISEGRRSAWKRQQDQVSATSEASETAQEKRPRGRPRTRPVADDSVKRPRGRPKKQDGS